MSDPEEDAMENAFFDLPDSKIRAKMTPEKLAILLSQREKGSPSYILVEHELNRRIANIQARASYIGTVSGMAGIIVGALLTAYLQKSPPTVNCPCERYHKKEIQQPVHTRKNI